MIRVRNIQKVVPVHVPTVRRTCKRILEAVGFKDWSMGVKITDNARIARFNHKYRGKSGPTDVLGFANMEWDAPMQPRKDCWVIDTKDLGDIIISAEYMSEYCQREQMPIDDHWRVILTHGCLHLLGFDHENEGDYMAMKAQENRVLQLLR